MANNFRATRIEKPEPITSRARMLPDAVLPPFNYIGELKAGLSGYWPATHPVELLYGTCTANAGGSRSAGFVIIKHSLIISPEGEVIVGPQEALKSLMLGASSTSLNFKMGKYLQPAIINPGEVLYVASFFASSHTNIVIQLYGKKLN